MAFFTIAQNAFTGAIARAYDNITSPKRRLERIAEMDNIDYGDANGYMSQERVGVALAFAQAEWEKRIVEPNRRYANGAAQIDKYIRLLGLEWPSAALDEDDTPEYTRNGQFQWCGAFVAACLKAAGLKREIRYYHMPSCSRLYNGHRKKGNWANRDSKVRRIPLRKVRPGDIVIVGYFDTEKNRRKERYKVAGSHITICAEVAADGKSIYTFEGNARGAGPDGKRYEGVIKQQRFFEARGIDYGIMHVIRPLEADFVD